EILPIGAATQMAAVDAWTRLVAGRPFNVVLTPGLDLGIRLGLALATASYFWQDVGDMAHGLARLAKGKRDPGARLAFQLALAAVPSLAVALAIEHFWGDAWHTAAVMAWSALGVGFLLFLFDRACMTVKRVEHAGFGDALLLGCAQAAAFVPGVGRIAAATAMARMLGYERRDAARFAFLISIPVLFASAAWHVPRVSETGQHFPTAAVLVGAVLAYVVALGLLALLMGWLRRRSFTPFALYRMALGLNLLVLAYGWL
ncbi:MAG: undecaprenyl-diphosphatase, partial [Alphaproteobacteria bacterium]|nr:undecaprenyl-diphosphatase [Alphaproteobacteria bacterium]